MKSNKLSETLIYIANIFGIMCMLRYAIPLITHNTNVFYADAMLPVQEWDRAGTILTMGVIPMFIANTAAYRFLLKDRIKGGARKLFFLPGVICAVLVVLYFAVSFLG